MKDQFVIFGVLIFFMKSSGSEGNCFGCTGKLKLETDGPAIFDAPISIKATIENAHEFEGPFYFNFSKIICKEYKFPIGVHNDM